MILQVHSDAGYANEKRARSRAGGHFFLSNNNSSAPNNGAIFLIEEDIAVRRTANGLGDSFFGFN